MKDESDLPGIIIYETREELPSRKSSSAKSEKNEKDKDASTPDEGPEAAKRRETLGGFTGRVYDKLTYRNIEGALVNIAKNFSVETNERGIFTVTDIKPGTYRITVSEEGYVIASRKSTAVAGKIIELDAFHLIPGCLAENYSGEAAEEGNEEVIEEILEETIETSPEVATVETTERERASLPEIRETVTEESPIDHPKSDTAIESFTAPRNAAEEVLPILEEKVEEISDKHIVIAPVEEPEEPTWDEITSITADEPQTPGVAAELTEAVVALPQQIALEDDFPVGELAFMAPESAIADVSQPEEMSEELSVDEASSETAMEEMLREETGEEADSASPLETASQIVIQENVPEVIQPEAAPQELPGEKSRLGKLWKTLRNKIAEELEIYQEQPSEPPAEAAAEEPITLPERQEESLEAPAGAITEESVALPEHQEQSSGPSMEIGSQIVLREEVIEEVYPEQPPEPVMGVILEIALQEETSEDIRPEELSDPRIEFAREMTQEEIAETVHLEQLSEPSMEVMPQIASQEEVTGEIHKEEQNSDLFVSDEIVSFLAEELQIPGAFVDSTEVAVAVPGQIIVENDSSVDDFARMFREAAIAEATKPEEMPQELSVGEMIQEETGEEAYQRTLSETSREIAPKIVPQKQFTEVTAPEEPQQELLAEKAQTKLQWWKLRKRKTKGAHEEETLEPSSEAAAEESLSPVEDQQQPSVLPVEVTLEITPQVSVTEEVHLEEPLESSIQVNLEATPQEEGLEAAHEEETSIDVSSDEKTAERLVADEDLEVLTDEDIASISDEERAVMLGEFDIVEVAGFIGFISVQPNPVFKGLPITIAYNLNNVAYDDPSDWIMQIILINPDTEAILETFETPVECPKGMSSIGGFTISTASHDVHVYRLMMQIISKETKTSHIIASTSLKIKDYSGY